MTLLDGWTRRVALAGLLLGGCHCAGEEGGREGSAEQGEAERRVPTGLGVRPTLPAWGEQVPFAGLALAEAELARNAALPAVTTALGSTTERSAAIWSVARIQPKGAADQMRALLDGGANATAAELAAVSFLEPPTGQPEEGSVWFDLEQALWTRYAVTEDLAVANALLLAIARVGGQRSQTLLGEDAAHTGGDAGRRASALEAIGMLCSRGYTVGPPALDALGQALGAGGDPATAAAYAIGRCAGPSAEQLAGSERGEIVELLVPLLTGEDQRTAKLAYKAMGSLGEVPEAIPPNILAAEGPAWLIEVEAVRALAAHADGRRAIVDRLAKFPVTAIGGTRTHVVMEALRGLRSAVGGSPEFVEELAAFKAAVTGARQSADGSRRAKVLALVGCELEFLSAAASGSFEALEQCAVGLDGLPTTYGRVLAVDALLSAGPAVDASQKAKLLLERSQDPSPPVAQAAVSALADLEDIGVSQALRRALVRDDVGVKAAAATAIATRAVDRSRRDPEAVLTLIDVLRTLDNETGVEARVSAIAALGHLARRPAKDGATGTAAGSAGTEAPAWLAQALVPLGGERAAAIRRAAFDALAGHPELAERARLTPTRGADAFGPRVTAALAASRASAPTHIRISSDAGPIVIDLRGAPAPIAQAVLASLAEAGFYDGLTFHRVVPGFVVQGGDPRGDGYGGPGFLIPCERSSLRYERGSVGIALAGKDTGGSQFFIAHGREPRLDARYTIVGQVVEGLEVVDEILPYDRMIEVKVDRAQ